MGPGHPFPDDIGENEIEQATLVDQLTPTQTGRQYRAGSETWSVAWSPDGTYFAWSCGGRKVRLVPWNRYKHHIEHNDSLMIEGQHVRCIDTGELVWAVAFGCGTAATTPNSINLNWWRYKVPKDLILATGLNSGRIRTWNVRTGELMLELIDHKDVIRDLKFAPNGTMSLASVSRDGTLKIWELNDDGNMRKTLQGTSKWIYSCEWSPDAKMMVTTGDSRSALLWDMVKLQRLGKLDGHNHDVCSCDFSPDGALLATASYDTRVVVWDPHTCTKLLELWHLYPPPSPIYAGGANGSYVRGVSFCHDGRHIASVADDGYVRFWDLFNSTTGPVQIALVNNAICCGYSPDGAALAVGTRNGSVTFWLSPMQVPSLQHICRMAIRRLVPSTKLDSLHLPSRIKSFLKYQDPSVQKMPIPTRRSESVSP